MIATPRSGLSRSDLVRWNDAELILCGRVLL